MTRQTELIADLSDYYEEWLEQFPFHQSEAMNHILASLLIKATEELETERKIRRKNENS